jgi:gliding motility-associated-like protein
MNPTDLDVSLYPGPYQYKIYRSVQLDDFSEIGSSNISSDLSQMDTVWIDTNINTRDRQFRYKIELLSNGESIGSSASASSVFLSGYGLDNRVKLNWNYSVPWENYIYYVLKLNDQAGFDTIGIVNTPTFTDSNLTNGKTYCYKLIAQGRYSGSLLPDSLYNHSQLICVMAEDNQAPCDVPNIQVDSDCELGINTLSWDNPNTACDTTDDVVSYRIYYKATLPDTFVLFDEIYNATSTDIVYSDLESVAGCYTVTAIDSFDNESFILDSVCVENCPYYELPNAVTPNGDGYNDLFIPFPYRYIRSIDLKVYNRWGGLVFETNNPDVNWDGTDMNTGKAVSPGVYFYQCTVNEVRLAGLVPVYLKGNVTIIYNEQTTTD